MHISKHSKERFTMAHSTGKVIHLFVSQAQTQGRVNKDRITLDEKGILEDKYHNTNIRRSVLLTSIDSYKLANKHNIEMPYGSLGENLLVDFNPYDLPPGQKLQIADAVLEISQYCTMCDHLSMIDEQLPELLKNDRGIFAMVVKGGSIKEGDSISIL